MTPAPRPGRLAATARHACAAGGRLARTRERARDLLVWTLAGTLVLPARAITPLADVPPLAATTVPGNVAFALSVEYPTAVSVAHLPAYTAATEFLGYFDPRKCYRYVVGTELGDDVSHFAPAGLANGTGGIARTCDGRGLGLWSGNFLNWAVTQTIDPFRWALTGGYRRVDTPTLTILERAHASGQGGTENFPNRGIPAAEIAGAAPVSGWTALNLRVQGLGNAVWFTSSGDLAGGTPTAYTGGPAAASAAGTVLSFRARVRVCDPSPAAGGLEANCVRYGDNYKPEGLVQRYAERMRFAAFGYLNDASVLRDGGVLRARMKFVGPRQPQPGAPPLANPATEWSPVTGVFTPNPDAADAAATAQLFGVPIADSGVANYLNKFGQIVPSTGYKNHDPVNELYYAALRYFRNLGNVDAWSSPSAAPDTATRRIWTDGFPVITNWSDPVLYSCQRNFVLGIGDVNTWSDKNVPGPTETAGEPAKPAAVSADNGLDAVASTNRVGTMQGLGASLATQPTGVSNSRSLMAGLAWQAHTSDQRPDLPDVPGSLGQTIDTYWLDVLEYQSFQPLNKFWLAAKYGGFSIPRGFDPATFTGDIPQAWWSTTGQTIGGSPKPDNYFTAGNPADMVAGLNAAFSRIATQIRPLGTSLATASPQVSASGSAVYRASYDASTWSGEVSAGVLRLAADGTPTVTPAWNLSARMDTQFRGEGWNSARRVVTWDPAGRRAVPVRSSTLRTIRISPTQTMLDAVDPGWTVAADPEDFVDWLRGDRRFEAGQAAAGAGKFRTRASLLADITGARLTVVGPPNLVLGDATNPGYAAFRAAWASRPTMVYVGTNGGMLHAVRGDLAGDDAGREVFSYVPSALFAGPNGTPQTDGLVALANPEFVHRNYVNATPQAFDVDFARTRADSGFGLVGGSPAWRTVLIGGLGKGGRSLYALDVTDPAGIRTGGPVADGEGDAAARVLWEFRDDDLGFTFGDPVVVKTPQHGWVVVVGSGYNNASGRGYFFLINPRNGALIEKVAVDAGARDAQAGLAWVTPFFVDRSDGTADAVYAGDLLGNVWRLDLTATGGTLPPPVRLAVLTDASGTPQPVTSAPAVAVHPATGRRTVLVGTGRLLDDSDVASSARQSFYALFDGTGSSFSATGPAAGAFPIRRSALVPVTDLRTGAVVPPDGAGWWLDLDRDLGDGQTDPRWRVITPASTFESLVAFAALLPGGDVCAPGGTSRAFIVDTATGRTAIPGPTADTVRPFVARTDVLTDLRFVAAETDLSPTPGAGGGRVLRTPRLIVDGSESGPQNVPFLRSAASTIRRLNWREVRLPGQ